MNNKTVLEKTDLAAFVALSLIIIFFFYFILGTQGALSIFWILILFFIPSYMILSNFDLRTDEKLVFSFFIAVGIFPSIAYWLGLIVSFKISIFVTFILLLLVAFLIKRFLKR